MCNQRVWYREALLLTEKHVTYCCVMDLRSYFVWAVKRVWLLSPTIFYWQYWELLGENSQRESALPLLYIITLYRHFLCTNRCTCVNKQYFINLTETVYRLFLIFKGNYFVVRAWCGPAYFLISLDRRTHNISVSRHRFVFDWVPGLYTVLGRSLKLNWF